MDFLNTIYVTIQSFFGDYSAILFDGLFGGLAAIGFAAVSVPPRRAFPPIVILAAVGHGFRFMLMHNFNVDIVGASFTAAMLVGFMSYAFGRWWVACPMTVLYIPALLPMIPGMYAYNAVLGLVNFVIHHKDAAEALKYMQGYQTNLTIAITVLFALGVGSALPVFLLHKSSYTLSRKTGKNVTK